MTPALSYHILLDLQILIDEIGAIFKIGHYAAHMSCCQYHIFWLLTVEKLTHGHAVH